MVWELAELLLREKETSRNSSIALELIPGHQIRCESSSHRMDSVIWGAYGPAEMMKYTPTLQDDEHQSGCECGVEACLFMDSSHVRSLSCIVLLSCCFGVDRFD